MVKKLLLTGIACLMFAGSASAWYVAGNKQGNWTEITWGTNEPENGALPHETSQVYIDTGSILSLDTNTTIGALSALGRTPPQGSGTLNIDQGYTLTVAGGANIGTSSNGYTGTLNISDGGFDVGGQLKIDSEGTVNLTGGTLDLSPKATVTGGGVLSMQSGTFTAGTNTSDGAYLKSNIEISGGTFNWLSQIVCGDASNPAELTVIGDDASITVKHIQTSYAWTDLTINFVLDETGVSTITNTSWTFLNNTKINVDGSAYTGGATNMVLFDGGMHPDRLAAASNITVTGFAEGYTVSVVQDTVANEMRLEISDGTILEDDFSTPGSPALGGRVAESNIDAGWMASWGPSNSSEWVVADGVMQNSATNTGAYPNAIASEGALVQVVSHGADSNTAIKLSFDYDVSAGDTLYVHLWGLDSTNALDGNWFANPQPCNGFIYDNTDRNAGLEAYSLKDGLNKAGGLVAHSGQALAALTGSGTYSESISLADLGISGIATAGDFEYYLLSFGKQEDGAEGTTSIDNLRLASVPLYTLWENDMTVDPVGDGWEVRGSSSNYTVSGGILTMDAGAWGTLLDTITHPDAQWEGITQVDLQWRATSVTDPTGLGAGLWMNVDTDAPDYGAIHFDALLLSNGTQTVVINSAGDGGGLAGRIATLPGFGTGMLTLSVEINTLANTITYEVTDGSLTNSGTVGYTPHATGDGVGMGTLFTAGPAAEVAYVRIEPNVTFEGTAYEEWAYGYGLAGDDAAPGTDYEPDGLDNLMEYALGGDPTVDDHAAIAPSTYTADDGGTDYFYHVYDERTDDPSLTYVVGATDNLVITPADTNEVSFVGESAAVDSFKSVTNRTAATTNEKFIKLEVQQN
jgi:hypothetical protein